MNLELFNKYKNNKYVILLIAWLLLTLFLAIFCVLFKTSYDLILNYTAEKVVHKINIGIPQYKAFLAVAIGIVILIPTRIVLESTNFGKNLFNRFMYINGTVFSKKLMEQYSNKKKPT